MTKASEINFTFAGKHCLKDMGCWFVKTGRGRILTPKLQRPEYEIAGVSGTIEYDGPCIQSPYKISGALVPRSDPKTAHDARTLGRNLSDWLTSGRQDLIFDDEPDKVYRAEVKGDIRWEDRVWILGALAFDFIVQPDAWDAIPTIKTVRTTDSCDILLPLFTSMPCPVNLHITNKGSTPITHVSAVSPSGTAEFTKNLQLLPGESLRINSTAPIGAEITGKGNEKRNALPHANRFAQLTIQTGDSIQIHLNGTADVRAEARGCRR